MARIFNVPVQPFVPNPAAPTVSPILAPSGTIQEVAKASHANGETLTFNNGIAAATVFEYRVTAGSVTAGHVKVDISAATDAHSVGVILAAVIAGVTALDVSASSDGSGLVTVTAMLADDVAYTLSTNVADVGYSVSGMAAPTGNKTWAYKLVGEAVDGTMTAASTAGQTTAGGAALGVANLNRVHWSTDPANAVKVHIYRTTDGAASTPSTTGLIGTVLAGVKTFDDTGLAGDSATASATNGTGVGGSVECASLRDKSVQVDGTFSSTNQIQGSCDGVNFQNEGSAASSAAVVNITTSWVFIRNKQTAYTSGTPTITLCGHEER